EEEGIVSSISKGVYIVKSDQELDIDKAIIDYYVNYFSGMMIGKALYNYFDKGTNFFSGVRNCIKILVLTHS
ncbi:MAG: hypothetical protein PHY22_03295, partial [Acholeplasmataceae bacterium]|nr:hypothetical protein [Acholeplasmataceae bacterium]